uniref:Uncharacterized protein n=1 Tax=Strongyloides stercoralis TaxID=6248 RepID=A0A0K0E3P0_STRER
MLDFKKSKYVLLYLQNQNDGENENILGIEKRRPHFDNNRFLLDPENGVFWDLIEIPRKYMKRNSKKWTKLGPIWG